MKRILLSIILCSLLFAVQAQKGFKHLEIVESDTIRTDTLEVDGVGINFNELISMQFSVDGSTSWHNTYVSEDSYFRISRNFGVTWGSAVPLSAIDDISDYFNTVDDDSDDIIEGATNLFLTTGYNEILELFNIDGDDLTFTDGNNPTPVTLSELLAGGTNYWLTHTRGIYYQNGSVAIGTTNDANVLLRVQGDEYATIKAVNTSTTGTTEAGYFENQSTGASKGLKGYIPYGGENSTGVIGQNVSTTTLYHYGVIGEALLGSNGFGVTGKGGKADFIAQSSGIYSGVERSTKPTTPASGEFNFYMRSGIFYAQDDADVEYNLMSTGGSGVTGVSSGDGLDFSTITSTGSITLGTPTTLDISSTNAVTSTSHTHELDLTAAVGISDLDMTGTPGSTTYLRGDGSWQTVTGSGTVVSVSAGDGLDFTTVTATGPVTLGTPSSLTASTTNAVTSTSHTHELDLTGAVGISDLNATGTPGSTTYLRGDGTWATGTGTGGVGTVTSVIAGNGLNFTTITGDGSVTLGTPTTLTAYTTNSVSSTSHTHELDLSSVYITAWQVSDFDVEVANNNTVNTNTAYRHSAFQLSGVYDYATLSGQILTLNKVDWDTDIENKPNEYFQTLTETSGAASWDVDDGINANITIDEPTLITLYNLSEGDELKLRVTQGDSGDDNITFVIDGFSGATEEWRNGNDLSDGTADVDYISVSYSAPYLAMTIGKNYIAQ